jgi:hypothetical protein
VFGNLEPSAFKESDYVPQKLIRQKKMTFGSPKISHDLLWRSVRMFVNLAAFCHISRASERRKLTL